MKYSLLIIVAAILLSQNILKCALPSNMRYNIDLKQLPNIMNAISDQLEAHCKNQPIVQIERNNDVAVNISIVNSTIKSLKIDRSQQKVMYKNLEFYLKFKSVRVTVEVNFKNIQGDIGTARQTQEGSFLIWGKLDMVNDTKFFNISQSHIKFDLVDDDDITVLKEVNHEPYSVKDILTDLYTKEYQKYLNQEIETALGIKVHYQLQNLIRYFSDKFDYDNLRRINNDSNCYMYTRKVGNLVYDFLRDFDNYQIDNNLMTVFLRADLFCSEDPMKKVAELDNHNITQYESYRNYSDRFLSGLNVIFDDSIVDQIQDILNAQQDINDYLVNDNVLVQHLQNAIGFNLNQQKKSKNYNLSLSNIRNYKIINLHQQEDDRKIMLKVNATFTLTLQQPEEAKDCNQKPCYYQQSVEVQFKVGVKQRTSNDKKNNLILKVQQNIHSLSDTLNINGEIINMNSLSKSQLKQLNNAYGNTQIFGDSLLEKMNGYVQNLDLTKVFFDDEFKAADQSLRFNRRQQEYVLSYQPDDELSLPTLTKIMNQKVNEDL